MDLNQNSQDIYHGLQVFDEMSNMAYYDMKFEKENFLHEKQYCLKLGPFVHKDHKLYIFYHCLYNLRI